MNDRQPEAHELWATTGARTRAGLTRRDTLRLLGAGVGVTLLAACGPATPATPASAPPATAVPPAAAPPAAAAPTAASAGSTAAAPATAVAPAAAAKPTVVVAAPATAVAGPQPKTGGTLRTSMAGDLGTGLEMHALQPTTFENLWLVHDRLIIYDDKSVPQPQLAESWEVSSDAKRIKLNLRKGVQYHSGREFTSDDVKYNIDRAKDPKVGFATFANQAGWFNVETPDKYTAILTSDASRPLTWDFLQYFNMVDKVTVDGPDGKSKLIGTGPFTFVEWVQGDHIALAKNKNYWRTGRPYLDAVRVTIAHDTQAMVSQLEGGAVDAIKLPPLLDFNRLKADPKFQGLLHPNNGTLFDFALNTSLPPMDNKKTRQALAYSVDRQRIVDTVMQGVTKTQNLLFLPSSVAYDPARANANAFDLDKARALLKEAGVTSLEMDVLPLPGGAMEGNSASEIWQADLAKLNIKLNIKSMDFAGWVDQVTNRKYTGAYWSNNSRANLLPGTMLSSSPSFNPAINNSGFENDRYTDLVSRSTSEADPVKQKQIYSDLNDLMLDEVFIIPVSTYPLTMLARSNVRDIAMQSYAGYGFTDAWLDG